MELKRIAKNYRKYLAFGASNLAVPLATVVTAPLLAHGLGVSGRGELAAATAPLLLVVSAATVGIPEAVTYLSATRTFPERLLQRAGIGLLLFSGAVGSLLLYAFSAGAFMAPSASDALIAIAPAACPTLAICAFRAAAAAREDWLTIAAERVLNGTIQLTGLIILFFANSLSVFYAALVIGFAPALAGVVYLFRRVKHIENESARTQDVVRGIASYGPRVWAGSVFGILLTRLDQVLMVPLSNTTELGLYVVAVTVGEVPLVISRAIRDIMLTKDSRNPSFESLARASRLAFLLCFGLVLIVLASMPLTIPFLFGDEFRGAYAALGVILVGILLGVPGSVAGSGLMARNRPGLRSWILVVAACVNVLLVILLVPPLGALGAALASFVAYALGGFANVLALRILYSTPMLPFFLPRIRARSRR